MNWLLLIGFIDIIYPPRWVLCQQDRGIHTPPAGRTILWMKDTPFQDIPMESLILAALIARFFLNDGVSLEKISRLLDMDAHRLGGLDDSLGEFLQSAYLSPPNPLN